MSIPLYPKFQFNWKKEEENMIRMGALSKVRILHNSVYYLSIVHTNLILEDIPNAKDIFYEKFAFDIYFAQICTQVNLGLLNASGDPIFVPDKDQRPERIRLLSSIGSAFFPTPDYTIVTREMEIMCFIGSFSIKEIGNTYPRFVYPCKPNSDMGEVFITKQKEWIKEVSEWIKSNPKKFKMAQRGNVL